MHCVKCNVENPSHAKFCFNCGSTIKTAANEEVYSIKEENRQLANTGSSIGGHFDSNLKSEDAEKNNLNRLIGNNKELHNYVINAPGISRAGLNIMCAIGAFIFGWLLAIAFNHLGKGGKGWLYVVPVILFMILSADGADELRLIGFLIYIAGWIHSNIILSQYESLARQRVTDIDRTLNSYQTANLYLEKGLLNSKVLRNKEQALIFDFNKAIQLPGGDPQLLNLAGAQYSAANRHEEARKFFNRALETAKEENLIKQIEKNLTAAG